ncbi:MAG: metallophosphoesterase, partial [Gammaproteobacteria bacterium]
MKNPVSFLSRTKTASVKPYLPEGVRVYCVGDIHGRADLLSEIHEKIRVDIGGFEGRTVLIYIGDYIDRGMHAREVVDVLLDS